MRVASCVRVVVCTPAAALEKATNIDSVDRIVRTLVYHFESVRGTNHRGSNGFRLFPQP
jgi:hypothetical protein